VHGGCRTAQELPMAHIHLPDGVFSIQWILFWWLLAATLNTMPIIVARRQIVTAQRLTIAAMVAAASFAIFQVNVPFAGGDLADYNAYSERVRQCGKLVM